MKTLITIFVFSAAGSITNQTSKPNNNPVQIVSPSEISILKKQFSFEGQLKVTPHNEGQVKPGSQFYNVPTEWVKVK